MSRLCPGAAGRALRPEDTRTVPQRRHDALAMTPRRRPALPRTTWPNGLMLAMPAAKCYGPAAGQGMRWAASEGTAVRNSGSVQPRSAYAAWIATST